MFNLNFTNKYRIVHINNELGNCVIGGAGTYMNQLYENRTNDIGFVYVNCYGQDVDLYAKDFLEQKDILIVGLNEMDKLNYINCDILVVQFYEFAPFITKELVADKKVVYVIHSVPTPEPMPIEDPFGGNDSIRNKFEKLCNMSDLLICVSEAEKNKLIQIFPHLSSKILVVYNGMRFKEKYLVNRNFLKSRKRFGFIGRSDYRKGILECLKEFRSIEGELIIACPKNDATYIQQLLNYIEASQMQDRVKFVGWCVGERKKEFYMKIDALIIPSLYEPFGYVALEGIECGVPLISSNNGGLGEILDDYRYTYNPYIQGALSKVIQDFMSDDNEVVKKQQEILLYKQEKFSEINMINEYQNIWLRLLEEKNESK